MAPGRRSRAPVRAAGEKAWWLLRDPAARRAVWLWRRHPANLFQPFNDTGTDRYPEVFSCLRSALARVERPLVVSFGCSTGQEVFTLRQYLPSARLIGLDINPANIRDARRALAGAPDGDVRFEVAGDTASIPSGAADAVVAMAVFRHGDLAEHPSPSCSHRLRFAAFERTLADIDRCLRPGGLLAIEFSSFRFADARTAEGYDCVLAVQRPPHPRVPLYGPDEQLLEDQRYGELVFAKRGGGPGSVPPAAGAAG